MQQRQFHKSNSNLMKRVSQKQPIAKLIGKNLKIAECNEIKPDFASEGQQHITADYKKRLHFYCIAAATSARIDWPFSAL